MAVLKEPTKELVAILRDYGLRKLGLAISMVWSFVAVFTRAFTDGQLLGALFVVFVVYEVLKVFNRKMTEGFVKELQSG